MTTNIVTNGSKYGGQEPDSLEALLKVMHLHALDPTFELYGDFAVRVNGELAEHYGVDPGRAFLFWGNFFELSHGFSIYTDDEDVITTLLAAIKENKGTRAYTQAREVRRAQESERAARDPHYREFLQRKGRYHAEWR